MRRDFVEIDCLGQFQVSQFINKHVHFYFWLAFSKYLEVVLHPHEEPYVH